MLRNQAEGMVQEKDTMQSGLDDTLIECDHHHEQRCKAYCHKRAVVEDKAGAPLRGECSEQ